MSHKPMIDNAPDAAHSKQNLSCNWTGSADFGRLVPFHWEELLQGDHVITCKPRVEMQMLPLASPTFGRVDLYLHYFVVPLRQLWQDFYPFWSRTGLGKDKEFPYLTPHLFSHLYNYSMATDAQKRQLFKHWTSLGLNPFFVQSDQVVTDNDTPIWLAPWRAYNKIWWDFYRDPEVLRDESYTQYCDDGDMSPSLQLEQDYALRYLTPKVRSIKNNWISDLFASNGQMVDPFTQSPFPYKWDTPVAYENLFGHKTHLNSNETDSIVIANVDEENFGVVNPVPNTSQQIRLVEALTRLSERLSLSGKRQIEQLFSKYGVKPQWSKMNLAQYVGGTKATVLIDNLINQSDTSNGDVGLPLGAKAGVGYCAIDKFDLEVSVEEPSILMGILSVMPHVHYVQGLSKKFQRKNLQDFFQDSLQYVGQVAVAKREVGMKYIGGPAYIPSDDGKTFAFNDPYYEYKMGLDILAGDFMSYHSVNPDDYQDAEKRDILYMQSMEQYIDFPSNRNFNLDNLLVDGDQFNKIFSYLGGGVDEDVDDHFHLSIDKEVVVIRPMEGFAIPTIETTQDPHKAKQPLGQDKML